MKKKTWRYIKIRGWGAIEIGKPPYKIKKVELEFYIQDPEILVDGVPIKKAKQL